MLPEDLQEATYRGAFFYLTAASTSGGRKTSKKTFVGSNLQVIEDLGLRQRTFNITGWVGARLGVTGNTIRTYKEVRDDLLEALDKGGVGTLIHPFYGKMDDIAAVSWSIDESVRRLGLSPITIVFEVSNTDGVPEAETLVFPQVVAARKNLVTAANADVAGRFSITSAFTGNFQDGLDKANSFVDAINDATAPAAIVSDQLDSFSSEISDFSSNVASLVSTPQDLADSITNIFDTINGLYATVVAAYESFIRLFTFGDLDVSFSTDTAGRIERQRNRDVYNANVRALALSYAYENASAIEFFTADEVDDVATVLENEYQDQVADGLAADDVIEAITQQRIVVTEFFQEQKITRPQIIEVTTPPLSTRLVAYSYYGSSALGDTIAKLNDLKDPSRIEGVIKIVTQ